ncbi:hypothetical protein BL250_17280 [Erwinia sp. OLTSP20]|uniref:putative T6SS immunity periplasmic lipoprotein n=1 Tax=unclassified Erwinia TaxID=2622719 RepID=UPI000C1A02F0|nr:MULTISPECIES: putative T6SS immunity periplasmic lipoprotein [unclassified Erwinia]PIJ49145.1 hypothetical protein BV501_13885 [Erwinia sp. OAMSP11]PIJ70465.1 hypothetical protein BK416_13485 [Erwinia sp. OLSSP12]PIJ79958.1 hypothetical protein BLD47_12420 [Erwinia sp. OLCASP19]PIJ81320.1 hypothetical protein BLD46_12875 [Erwinia sp. OLMTSP26]PIJ88561.1 hypothetical protein BL250_17280 [Erwinia sp. OLTSP20]
MKNKTSAAWALRKTAIMALVLAGLQLTGCARQQPGQSEVYRTYAKIVGNKVCITLPHLHSGEKLFSIYISERGNVNRFMMRQYPWQKGKYLAAVPGKCVNDFNFPYVIGRGYDVAIQVVDPSVVTISGATQGRVYSGAFALWRAGDKLQVVPVI